MMDAQLDDYVTSQQPDATHFLTPGTLRLVITDLVRPRENEAIATPGGEGGGLLPYNALVLTVYCKMNPMGLSFKVIQMVVILSPDNRFI